MQDISFEMASNADRNKEELLNGFDVLTEKYHNHT